MNVATPLVAQASTLECLARIASKYPALPGAYIVVSQIVPNRVGVQLHGFQAVEAWREALGVPFEQVVLSRFSPDRVVLEFSTTVRQLGLEAVDFEVYGIEDVAAPEAGAS
ncbi:hypothetical protein SAZ_25315 [Streptomyces noursei ZPM]|uniref:Uncharacterized protein n=1 Tax=Streptomyces noursei TaxID=1971 RepID=A0A401R5F6_STRNR|nr:hypothetical protein [Streptomyces noursei]AKA08830.1 hypothetical protein SAZ_25315 [Streptomyces noursei ZPM]EOT04322.1 hypothetical protein K530_09203 [Streptomyces noursei CCRC 11814]EXU86876.1 hypothetical protein P354_39995 [Streptomyces noursei PD-1]GCB92884.1 hypothetical protein SALB_05659 [Streptomyces noursei]